MSTLSVYLPIDRRLALLRGEPLPDRTSGAALLVDISGFTPLTEALQLQLGPRRGAEALTRELNAVYDTLIASADAYGGSVIAFAGDAITCWFDDGGGAAALRAATCAVAMQRAMRSFAAVTLPDGTTTAIAIKAVVTSGAARRFQVGLPSIQLLDALAGAAITRIASAEPAVARGEVVVDEPTAALLGPAARLGAWRAGEPGDPPFAVVEELLATAQPQPWPEAAALADEQLRPWLLPSVYAREQAGQGEFLTELRPIVALFLSFAGLDYDHADAGARLDALVCDVQRALARYDGALLQVTIGDKGSYMYAAFGAPTAHEDDQRRAVQAAIELRQIVGRIEGVAPPQIGLSAGMARTGAYGGATRRTYGVLGDEVNLAARLMQHAAPGEILVAPQLRAALAEAFAWEALPPVRVKGKAQPVQPFALGAGSPALGLIEPHYSTPMIGRAAELADIAARLELALGGRGQVVAIVGEAGMGKSRLVAECVGLAEGRGLTGYGGTCLSYGTSTSYLVWGAIWRAFFGVDAAADPQASQVALAAALAGLAPERQEALPLLGVALGLLLPENSFTSALEPQLRKSTLEAMLLDCLRATALAAGAAGQGLLLVLEDLHWIDPASLDLLERVARAIADLPVLILLTYRPSSPGEALELSVERLPHCARVVLGDLGPGEVGAVIRGRLARLGHLAGAPPPSLVEQITARAQGNPFFAEELINYLYDAGVDLANPGELTTLDLPTSLHSLILSRVDQLSEQQKITLKVASVIGRLFSVAWLYGYYPALGDPALVKRDLSQLERLDLTPMDTPEPDLAYFFKHVVTQEVIYESLAYATRAALHEQLAAYLERLAGANVDRYLNLLAYHYERSANHAKKREYLSRAGKSAAAQYANVEAMGYLTRALEHTPEDALAERFELLQAREQVADILAQREVQARDLAALEALAEALDDDLRRAAVAVRRANYADHTADYPQLAAAAARAIRLAEGAGAPESAMHAYRLWAWGLVHQGAFEEAHAKATTSLGLARALGDRRGEADALIVLGSTAIVQEDTRGARASFEHALEVATGSGDRLIRGYVLAMLGNVAQVQGDYGAAQDYLNQGLPLARANGDRRSEGWVLNELGDIARQLGDYARARPLLEQSLALAHEIGHPRGLAGVLVALGHTALGQGDAAAGADYGRQALRLSREMGDQNLEAIVLTLLGDIELERGGDAAAHYAAALELRRALGQLSLASEPLSGLAQAALAAGDPARALALAEEVLAQMGAGAGNDQIRVYLRCFRVLRALGDPRAAALLREAHALLLAHAERIPDPAARHSFLTRVPQHQAVLAAWSAQPPDPSPTAT